ncbi:hypothetical protein MICRO80W_260014 [Micrococcus luteus]|nr:hypothetical protein MICRO80W_260014 [Micrococcus luteus]
MHGAILRGGLRLAWITTAAPTAERATRPGPARQGPAARREGERILGPTARDGRRPRPAARHGRERAGEDAP